MNKAFTSFFENRKGYLKITDQTFVNENICDQNIKACTVSRATFLNCIFKNVACPSISFGQCKFIDCKFIETDGPKMKFSNCTFIKSKFINSNFNKADFEEIIFDQCQFKNTSVFGASFIECKIWGPSFDEIDETSVSAFVLDLEISTFKHGVTLNGSFELKDVLQFLKLIPHFKSS